MVGLAPILVLAAACWLVRVMFIVFVPAERLPGRVTAALGHVAPAVLAAHVSLELAGLVPAGAPQRDSRLCVASRQSPPWRTGGRV
jgi:branched-subunit amino acid transport protein